ncbi:hypothetical protein CEXT_638471 [Caerostris extrusa]|uniref:Uncharacterized protein n=1 Tax=Caerostris extrusa TaxID=172846 RepID=A0AAV4SXG6_CAEEX|nr:hypothetical protein CEXT_638471 [Caerostris extrusa]
MTVQCSRFPLVYQAFDFSKDASDPELSSDCSALTVWGGLEFQVTGVLAVHFAHVYRWNHGCGIHFFTMSSPSIRVDQMKT